MRQIIVKLSIRDNDWDDEQNSSLIVEEALDDSNSTSWVGFEVLSDSRALNLDAMLALA